MDHYAWISQPSDHTGCQVARAFRRATRQQNHVALGQSAMQHPLKLLGIVGHDPERQRGTAQFLDRGREHCGVAVVDLTGADRSARWHDLIAGRKNRHARLAPDRDLAQADGGEHADFARGKGVAAP